MKSTISVLASYMFMASLTALAISAFAIIVIVARHYFVSVSDNEVKIGYNFLIIFIASAIIAPITLYINLRCDKIENLEDEESF